jgi:hypothetical protein
LLFWHCLFCCWCIRWPVLASFSFLHFIASHTEYTQVSLYWAPYYLLRWNAGTARVLVCCCWCVGNRVLSPCPSMMISHVLKHSKPFRFRQHALACTACGRLCGPGAFVSLWVCTKIFLG